MQNQNNKKAFTLVELIVVITILSILATIAFISFGGYSRDVRNSKRISDFTNIQKVLSIHNIRESQFPIPTNGVEITYSGSTVWTQGTFGNKTVSILGSRSNISNVPLDPLTENEYTYSVSNTKQEYQLAGVFEGNLILYSSNLVNAAGERGTTKIFGNYNCKIIQTQTGGLNYYFTLPTIISGNIGLTNLTNIIDLNKLVYNNSNILPSSYSGTTKFEDNSVNGTIVNSGSFLLYKTDNISELDIGIYQNILSNNLKKAYSGSVLDTDTISKISDLNNCNKLLKVDENTSTEIIDVFGDDSATMLYKFDSDLNDTSGNYNASWTPSANYSYVNGVIGNAVQINSLPINHTYLGFDDNTFNYKSFSFWVYLNGHHNNDKVVLGYNFNREVYQGTFINTIGFGTNFNTGKIHPIQKWVNVVVTINGNIVKVYHDNILWSTITVPSDQNYFNATAFGGIDRQWLIYAARASYLNGSKFDHIRVFNRGLDVGEVEALYNEGL